MKFPVKPGDVLEFEIDGVTVRGDVGFVTFTKYGDDYATIDCEDVFTKNCRKCNLDKKTKCKFFCDGECIICKKSDCDTILDNEIGEKYKIVSKSWNYKED